MRAGIEPTKLRAARGKRSQRRNQGTSREELKDINRGPIEGDIECASDASVKDNKMTVAVWIGRKSVDEGIMLTSEVR